MDVFSLRDTVVGEYRKFATSFTTIHAEDIRQQVEAIYAQGRFWPEPLIQINPSYKKGANLADLIGGGALEPRTADIFRADGAPLSLYKHQEQAIALAAQGESYVVTTGTGSGKSLCFFIPIVNAVLAEKRMRTAPRTRAIIIYPMNALANSQLEELDKFIKNVPGERPVTFARYTGQEDTEERRRISENPPDILLTNFMMLELLMTRQDELDRRVIGNCAGLRFLVLDELHTYRGRQGADVALLVRRVRERLSPEKLQCIGTSSTMASEGSLEDKGRVVARVASKLFSIEIPESNVIVETLERVTDSAQSAKSVQAALGPAIDAGLASNISDAALRTHPLTIWVETRLGVSWSEIDQRWVRARPLTVEEAARALSTDAGREVSACRSALRSLLLVSSIPERERAGAPEASARGFFAFKLHQFISGAGHAYATLEAPGQRTVNVDGQQFLPGEPDKRLYPVHLCRDCGHEYHPVRFVTDGGDKSFLARDIDDAAPVRPDDDESATDDADGAPDREIFGFLTPHARDADLTFADRDEDYPETWLEYDAAGNPRLQMHYRGARARSVTVAPNGKLGAGTRAWFIPGKFRFCLRCGATQGGAARDRNRLKGFNLQEAESTLRQVLSYRVWFDQRRGWRYTNPNLEQLELVEVDYLGIDELAADDELFAIAPAVLRHASHRVRAAIYRELLDHLRKWMAIRSQVLEPTTIEQIVAKSHSRLRAPWGFGIDEKPRRARWLMISPPSRRDTTLRDEDLIVRGGSRSALGKLLRASTSPSGRKLWDDSTAVRALKSKEFDTLIEALLRAASTHGLISEEVTPLRNQTGWRLNDACVLFKKGTPAIDPKHPNESAFFRDFYANLARLLRDPVHPLFGFEAREHTAQVDGEKRAVREKRFRYGGKEREELAADEKHLREIGEANRFLPVLFCSPTMELGVGDEPTDPTASPRQWIVPSVQDRKNALLLQPTGQELSQATLATLQHALLRGIEAVFQLEEGEILAEPMPTRDERSGFLLYEATEGGAGVLTRLVAEPERLAEVARKALSIMHFAVTDEASLPADGHGLVDAPDTACVAACYRCLMSYFNQPDHERIDRRDPDAKSLLARLARATTSGLDAPHVSRRSTRPSAALGADDALARFCELARARELPSPDPEPMSVGGVGVPLVWRGHYVAVLLDGALAEITGQLEDKRFEVIAFDGDESACATSLERLTRALGRSS